MMMNSVQQIRLLGMSVFDQCFATKVTLGRSDHEPSKDLKGP